MWQDTVAYSLWYLHTGRCWLNVLSQPNVLALKSYSRTWRCFNQRTNFKMFCLEKLVPGWALIQNVWAFLSSLLAITHCSYPHSYYICVSFKFGCCLVWLPVCHSSGVLPASALLACFPEDGESVRGCLSPGSDRTADVLIPWLGPAIRGLFCFLFFLEVLC